MCFISKQRNNAAIINASASEIGVAIMTPFSPGHCVNRMRSGTSKTSCLDGDITEPSHAFPMEGKKVVQEVCIPFRNITAVNPLAYLVANSKYSSADCTCDIGLLPFPLRLILKIPIDPIPTFYPAARQAALFPLPSAAVSTSFQSYPLTL